MGNLVISSGFGVSAEETNNTFILENSRINVVFNNTDSLGDTANIINSITLKDNDESASGGFSFDLGNGTSCDAGSFTSIDETGGSLASASVTARINQSNVLYDLVFTLESEADFIKVEVK
jgi:hypothetical protein